MERIYVVSTRLTLTDELKEYLNEYMTFYNHVQRRVFQDIKHSVMNDMGWSKYVSYICNTYGMLKRSVNSIVYDMNGRIKAYRALKKTELLELRVKLKAVEKKIAKKQAIVDKMKFLAASNRLSEKELQLYRNDKMSLYWLKNKQNCINQKIASLEQQIKKGAVSLCFGSKAMFSKQYRLSENGYKTHEKWYHEFVKQRDKGIYFLGSGDETCGNQILQLHYQNNGFRMELSKDKPFRNECKKLILEDIQFSYMNEDLVFAIQNHQSVTYRISRKGRKWYLTAMFRMDVDIQTNNDNGVIGIDYNDGFLEVVETNGHGNMVSAEHIALAYHGTGNKAESEIKEKLSRLVRQCLSIGKDIVVEDLNFKGKKSKCLKNGNKRYNKMIHLFDYHRYLFWMENLCMKYGVGFRKVNPAYTSQIGKQKYADVRKLTVHRAAALVIARRGQGFEDKLVA